MTIELPLFTVDDADLAYRTWGCNCGPSALAAMCGLTLDQVRPHMGDFERKGYTNPTLMFESLRRAGVAFTTYKTAAGGMYSWPRYGLARVQWEGPWTNPGVPIRARYRHTHWVGAAQIEGKGLGIFDINAMANGQGWCSFASWRDVIVPFILKGFVPHASGGWHITHSLEIERPQP